MVVASCFSPPVPLCSTPSSRRFSRSWSHPRRLKPRRREIHQLRITHITDNFLQSLIWNVDERDNGQHILMMRESLVNVSADEVQPLWYNSNTSCESLWMGPAVRHPTSYAVLALRRWRTYLVFRAHCTRSCQCLVVPFCFTFHSYTLLSKFRLFNSNQKVCYRTTRLDFA
jgi:hypothetical protein